MVVERYTNGATTTLNGGITNSALTLVVNSATDFPSSGNFRILIGSEIMIVTAVSGTTFTVSRGQEGTTAAAHSNTDSVLQILTAGGLNGWVNNHTYLGAQPAAEFNRVQMNDFQLGHDNGSNWFNASPMWRLYPVNIGSFGWVNQGSAAYSNNGGVLDVAIGSVGGENARCLSKAQPTPPYSVTALWVPDIGADDYAGVGIGFREITTTRLSINLFLVASNKHFINVRRLTNPGLFSSDYASVAVCTSNFVWLRLRNDGTNLFYDFCYDGINWNQIATDAIGSFITPNEVFFCIWAMGQRTAGFLYSWHEG